MRGLLCLIFTMGCSAGASMVVKPPLVSQCQRLPIQGCGDLVDGVLLQVDGDDKNARLKIDQVVHQNGPGRLRPFARVLRETASAPGMNDYAHHLRTVAEWIDPGESPAATAGFSDGASHAVKAMPIASAANQGPAAEPAVSFKLDDTALRALSASADPLRVVTETIDFASRRTELAPCRIAEIDALCLKSREGPLIITDVIGSSACAKRMFVGASISDTPDFGIRWLMEPGPVPLTGARLLVRGGDWLQFAVVPDKKQLDQIDCRITWSAFQPWIVTR